VSDYLPIEKLAKFGLFLQLFSLITFCATEYMELIVNLSRAVLSALSFSVLMTVVDCLCC